MSDTEFSLPEHHVELEAHFQRLMARCQDGDPIELRCEWSLFERELTEHLDLEEKELIPRFRRDCPAEAAQICREHEEIRMGLAELGIALDLHALRAEAVKEFLDLLRAHVQREEALFYRWVAQHGRDNQRWLSLGQRLGELTRGISAAFSSAATRDVPRERQ
jgi:hemerythrin-like domain-containing protein